MGVKGLWTLLEPTAEPVTLESLEGKKLAIDISIWLHQATHGYANFQSSTKFPHLLLLLSRIAKLLFYNIHPVFVFDGPRVPMFKRKILRDRQVKRYLDELTLSKSQKKALESIASTCQGEAGTTHDDLNKMSNNMPKAQNDANDIFNIPSISSAETSHQPKLSDDDGEHSWDFVESVMDRLESDDDRIEYLTAAKERAKHIHFSTDKVPDESKSFSEFQMRRLLKRNLINDQLEMIKKESLQVYDPCMTSDNVKVAFVDGSRSHILTDDIIEVCPEKEKKFQSLKKSVSEIGFLHETEKSNDATEVAEVSMPSTSIQIVIQKFLAVLSPVNVKIFSLYGKFLQLANSQESVH